MGASSVTGKGLGSADKNQKGAEHMRLGAEKIIGPRVVYAGVATTDGSGDVTVKLPELSGVSTDYIAVVTETGVAAAGACAVSLTIATGSTTLVLKGPASTACNILVIKKGLAV
jgi:hypothetical protein